MFSSDQSKAHYILLRRRTLAWAEAINANQLINTLLLNDFVAILKGVFDHADHCGNASKRLLNLRQGTRSVADYSVEFRMVAADAGRNDQALWGMLLRGL